MQLNIELQFTYRAFAVVIVWLFSHSDQATSRGSTAMHSNYVDIIYNCHFDMLRNPQASAQLAFSFPVLILSTAARPVCVELNFFASHCSTQPALLTLVHAIPHFSSKIGPPTMPRFNGTQCIPNIPMLVHKYSPQVFTVCSGPGNQPPTHQAGCRKPGPRLGSLHRSPRIRYQHLRPVPGQCDAVGQRRPGENVGH